MLTISNFDTILKPDALSAGKKIIQKKGVKNLTEAEKGEWVSQVKDGKETYDVFVQTGKNQTIKELFCTCAEYAALLHLESGEEKSCSHTSAALFRIRTKLMGAPELSQGAGKKGNKADKDASQKLLESLEPAKVIDFVQRYLHKDLAFKSQFMLHFSAHEVVDEVQYKNIIKNAIKNVKGRKRSLTVGDGTKISQLLTPLLDQATAAESKRHYREAQAITKLFISEILPLQTAFKTESEHFTQLVERIRDLWFMLAASKNSPPDFQSNFYDELKKDFLDSYKDVKNPLRPLHFKAFNYISKATDRLDTIAEILATDIAKEEKQKVINLPNLSYSVLFLADFLEKVKEDQSALLQHLEQYKKLDAVFIRLIETYLKEDKAVAACAEIDKKLKEIEKLGKKTKHFTRTPEFWTLHYTALTAADRGNEAADMAEATFIATDYSDFEAYNMVKNVVSSEDWEIREKKYLKATQSAKRSKKKQNAFFTMLELGFHYKLLYSNLLKAKNFDFLDTYSRILQEDKPEEYLDLVKKLVLHALADKKKKDPESIDENLVKTVGKLAELKDGDKLQQFLLKKMNRKDCIYQARAKILLKA